MTVRRTELGFDVPPVDRNFVAVDGVGRARRGIIEPGDPKIAIHQWDAEHCCELGSVISWWPA